MTKEEKDELIKLLIEEVDAVHFSEDHSYADINFKRLDQLQLQFEKENDFKSIIHKKIEIIKEKMETMKTNE